jgi:hypothetical protein
MSQKHGASGVRSFCRNWSSSLLSSLCGSPSIASKLAASNSSASFARNRPRILNACVTYRWQNRSSRRAQIVTGRSAVIGRTCRFQSGPGMAEPTVEILAQFFCPFLVVFCDPRQPLANATSRRAWWGALWPQASSFAGATVQVLGTSMVAATFARCSRKASCAGPHLASGGFSRGAYPPGAVSCAENVSMQLRVCSLVTANSQKRWLAPRTAARRGSS